MPSLVGSEAQTSLDRGYAEYVVGEKPRPVVDNTEQLFWYNVGWALRAAGAPPVDWSAVTKIASTTEERGWYDEGWANGARVRAGNPAAPVSGPTTNPAYGEWYTAAFADGKAGTPKRYLVAGQKAPIVDNRNNGGPPIVAPPVSPPPVRPPVGFPRPAPRYKRYRVFEVCAFVLGKRVPLDALLTASKFIESDRRLQKYAAIWLALNNIRVLGDAPGEEQEGFQLSGPTGPAAQYLAWLEAQGHSYNLRDYNLPAWFATRTKGGARRGGIRFLSRPELLSLGIDPDEYA